MLQKGPAKKVIVWVNEDTRYHHEALWMAVFEYLRHKQIAGASVTHTKLAFGDRKRAHNADAAEVPEFSYRIEFTESPERVDEVLPTLYEMVADGLIELQDTVVVKSAKKDRHERRISGRTERRQSKAKLMRIFFGERDRWHGEPLHDAIVKRLRMMDIAGATVYRGVMGYGAKGETHRTNILHISEDLPIMISVVDSAEKIAEAEPVVEAMLEDGLMSFRTWRLFGWFTARRRLRMSNARQGRLLRIHLCESDASGGRPNEVIIEKCRDLGIAGATVLRGLEGYGETAEVHRSGLLRSDQPIVVVVVDTQDRVSTLLAEVEKIMTSGTIAISDVEMLRIDRSGTKSDRG